MTVMLTSSCHLLSTYFMLGTLSFQTNWWPGTILPSYFKSIREQKIGEVKVTANRPQHQDSNPGWWTPTLEFSATRLYTPPMTTGPLTLSSHFVLMLWPCGWLSPVIALLVCMIPCISALGSGWELIIYTWESKNKYSVPQQDHVTKDKDTSIFFLAK